MSEQIKTNQPSRGLVATAYIALCILWGSTYLGNLYAIKTIPPFIMAGTRFFTAGFLLYLWCLFNAQKTPPFRSFIKISFVGFMLLFVGTGAVIWAEQYLPSGITAVIVAIVPLWFVLLDKKEWPLYFSNKWIIIGLLIGFFGVLLLFSGKGSVNFRENKMHLISFFVLTIGSICWAIGSLYSKYQSTKGTTTIKAAIQMMAAGISSFIFAVPIGEFHHFTISQVSWISIRAVAYLIVFGSLIGYISYIWLLSVRPPSVVGTYAYVNPVVAVLIGWLIAGEKINTQQIAALIVILSGVIIVNFSKAKKVNATSINQ